MHELRPGNVVRLKKTPIDGYSRGIILAAAGFSSVGEPLVKVAIFCPVSGRMAMTLSGTPDAFVVPASRLVILAIDGCTLPDASGFDLYPSCVRCDGYGYLEPRRGAYEPCRHCRGRGHSEVMRRLHPEFVEATSS